VYRRYASLFFLVGVDNDEDFEALTLNLLARTIETVEGGGLIILLPSLRPDLQRYRALVLSDAVLAGSDRFPKLGILVITTRGCSHGVR
jgi:hypothetical protein